MQPKIYCITSNHRERFNTSSLITGSYLYFSDLQNINYHKYDQDHYLWLITLPTENPQFKMRAGGDEQHANMLNIGKCYDLSSHETYQELKIKPPIFVILDWIRKKNLEAFQKLQIMSPDNTPFEHKHLDTLKKLAGKHGLRHFQELFQNACRYGCLNLAQWIYSLTDNHPNFNYAFKSRRTYANEIDIHANWDAAFRLSCRYGHLDVAKWLFSLGGINVCALNNNAFKQSCYYRKLHVARWILQLDKSKLYHITIYWRDVEGVIKLCREHRYYPWPNADEIVELTNEYFKQ